MAIAALARMAMRHRNAVPPHAKRFRNNGGQIIHDYRKRLLCFRVALQSLVPTRETNSGGETDESQVEPSRCSERTGRGFHGYDRSSGQTAYCRLRGSIRASN